VIGVQGDGTWRAWDEFERLAEEHAQTCERARERWRLETPERPATPAD
jgi:hypothetical protein